MGHSLLNIALLTGWTTLLTTFAVMLLAVSERKQPAAPINAISHIVYGEEAYSVSSPEPKYVLWGLALNLSAMIGWSVIAEIIFRVTGVKSDQTLALTLIAAVVSALAYVVDYHVVPKRFTPGFENVLSSRALFCVYVVLALGFLMGGIERVS